VAAQTGAGAAVAATAASAAGQSIFEPVETKVFESEGDPAEQIEEELQSLPEPEEEGAPMTEEERRRRRGQ
jgi:hypothetical protein